MSPQAIEARGGGTALACHHLGTDRACQECVWHCVDVAGKARRAACLPPLGMKSEERETVKCVCLYLVMFFGLQKEKRKEILTLFQNDFIFQGKATCLAKNGRRRI